MNPSCSLAFYMNEGRTITDDRWDVTFEYSFRSTEITFMKGNFNFRFLTMHIFKQDAENAFRRWEVSVGYNDSFLFYSPTVIGNGTPLVCVLFSAVNFLIYTCTYLMFSHVLFCCLLLLSFYVSSSSFLAVSLIQPFYNVHGKKSKVKVSFHIGNFCTFKTIFKSYIPLVIGNGTPLVHVEFGKSQRAVKNREKWRKLVAKSSVVPQRPSRLRD